MTHPITFFPARRRPFRCRRGVVSGGVTGVGVAEAAEESESHVRPPQGSDVVGAVAAPDENLKEKKNRDLHIVYTYDTLRVFTYDTCFFTLRANQRVSIVSFYTKQNALILHSSVAVILGTKALL